MDESLDTTRARLMNYLHHEAKTLLNGLLFVGIGIIGMNISLWTLKGIFDGYSGRINLFIFILPVIMGGLILWGVLSILTIPSSLKKKSIHSKLLNTEEGEKILIDFIGAPQYFDDKIRFGKSYLYKSGDDIYPFYNIELFKLVKQEKSINLLYKNKGDSLKNLITFYGEDWQKNKNSIIAFF